MFLNGEIAGLAGVVRQGNAGLYFTDFKPELEPYLKSVAIMRVVKDSMEIVRDYLGPVVAVAETVEGCKLLNRLGFKHLHGVIYQWAS